MTYMIITYVDDHYTIVKIDITHEHASSLTLSNTQQVFDMYFINFMFIVQLLHNFTHTTAIRYVTGIITHCTSLVYHVYITYVIFMDFSISHSDLIRMLI